MFNLSAFDEMDILELENSYNTIRNKNSIDVITDLSEKQRLLQKVLNALRLPPRCVFSIQNLFKLKLSNGQFYIAQCLLDYGFQTNDHKYNYQLIGIAESTIDLGKTFLRPETKSDKFVGYFFSSDIQIENAERFNEKYYLVSNKKGEIVNAFNQSFINSFSSCDNIYLYTDRNDIFVTFDSELAAEQSRIVEEIFSKFKYLTCSLG